MYLAGGPASDDISTFRQPGFSNKRWPLHRDQHLAGRGFLMPMTGLRTKREAVDMGLKALLKLEKQESIRTFRGKLDWEGDLDEMRFDK